MTIVTWAVYYAFITRSEKPSMKLHAAGRVFSVWAYVAGVTLFITYWGSVVDIVAEENLSFNLHSLYQHAFLPALMIFDAVITPISFR